MEWEWGGIVIVPLIVGLVEAAKRVGLAARYAALLALGLGLAISLGAWIATQTGEPLRGGFQAVLAGLALGLSASGLYSVGRAVGGREGAGNNREAAAPSESGGVSG